MILKHYAELMAKVDAFSHTVLTRRREDMACRAGCDACCHVSLAVSPIEAANIAHYIQGLSAPVRDKFATEAQKQNLETERCVFLDSEARCEIYAARPLVCRTQGLPLAYPPGFVPAEAIVARGHTGRSTSTFSTTRSTAASKPAQSISSQSAASEALNSAQPSEAQKEPASKVQKEPAPRDLTWCPLNFKNAAPAGEDVFDANLADTMLALINQAYCKAEGVEPLRRVPLIDLAAQLR